MKKLLGLLALGAALALAGHASAQNCHPTVPVGPNTAPPSYNWTPLAKQWCQQLAACGFSRPDCVATFVTYARQAAAGKTGPAAAGAGDTDTNKAPIKLACKDTEEAHAGKLVCDRRETRQPPRRTPPAG